MKDKYETIASYLGMPISRVMYYVRRGAPMNEMLCILIDETRTRRQKKTALFDLRWSVSRIDRVNLLDNVWERFIGDRGYKYNMNDAIMQPFHAYCEERKMKGATR